MSHQTRKCDKFNLIFLDSGRGSTVFLERKLTAIILCHIKHHRYLVYFTRKQALIKVQKTTFALSDFVLLLVCHIDACPQQKCKKNPFVAIYFGLREEKTLICLGGPRRA